MSDSGPCGPGVTERTTSLPAAPSPRASRVESPQTPPYITATPSSERVPGPRSIAANSSHGVNGAPRGPNAEPVSKVRRVVGTVWKKVPFSPAGSSPSLASSAAM